MELLDRLLEYYDLSNEEYHQKMSYLGLGQIPNPFSKIDGFAQKIDFIKSFKGKKVVIYGDYDVDGIMSTSILVYTLKKLDFDVGYFIPSRYEEGYGLNASRVKQFKEKGYSLIITVDNGIAAFEEIDLALKEGLEVFVIDHHEAKETLPLKEDKIIHQFVSHYVDYNISAAFLSLLVSYGLLNEYDPYLTSLAAIAVISDMMPLKEANIALLRQGITNIRRYKFLPLRYLFEANSNKPIKDIDEDDISYNIVSPLNSLGRMCRGIETNNAVKFLLSNTDKEVTRYGNFILDINKVKKEKIKELISSLETYEKDEKIIITYIPSIDEGLVGIIANTLLSKYHKSVIVFTDKEKEEGILVGSSRSCSPFNMLEMLTYCKDLLIAFGGHKNACGASLEKKNLDKFKELVNFYLKDYVPQKIKEKTILLDVEEINSTTFSIVETFGPFGNDNPPPLFEINVDPSRLFYKNGHSLTKVNRDGRIVIFNYESAMLSLSRVTLKGNLKKSYFAGRYSYDLISQAYFDE